MADLTPAEIQTFLAEPERDALLATVSGSGQPHAVPVWYTLDAGEIVFSTRYDSVKGRNMAANPKVAVCVSQPGEPITFVTVQGVAEEVREVEEKRRLVGAIMAKYGDPNPPQGDMSDTLVIRVKPRRVVGVRY